MDPKVKDTKSSDTKSPDTKSKNQDVKLQIFRAGDGDETHFHISVIDYP
jgi:hypothetical protein